MERKAKYKIGDRVVVPTIGKCTVRKSVEIGGEFRYVLECDGELLTVTEREIQGE